MRSFAQTLDEEEILHEIGSSITSTQDGQVLDSGGSPVAKLLDTGKGVWRAGTFLRINVANADVGTAATYLINLLGRPIVGSGSFVNLGTWEIPGGTVNQMRNVPVSNLYWDGVAQAEIKVELELGPTNPDLDSTIALVRIDG